MYLGEVGLTGLDPHAFTLTPGDPVRALILEPPGFLGNTATRQRVLLAVFVLLLGLLTRWERPHVLVFSLVGLWYLRYLAFGLVLYGAGDLHTYFLPSYDFASRWLSSGVIPLWNPHVFFGVPFLADMQTMVCYPPMAILRTCGLPYGVAGPLLYASHLALAGSGMAVLARVHGARGVGQTIAAIAYVFSPQVTAYEQDAAVATLAWLPWLGLVAARHLVWTGPVVVAFTLLAGHVQLFLYGLLAVAVVALAAAPTIRRGARDLVEFGLSLLGGAVLAAVLLMPVAEFAGESTRSQGLTPAHALSGAFSADGLAAAVRTGIFGRPVAVVGSSSWPESVTTGPTVWPLAVLGCLAAPRHSRRRARGLIGVAILGILVALGDIDGLVSWLPQVPLLRATRTPGRALLMVSIACSVLAGLAVETRPSTSRRLLIAMTVGLLPLGGHALLRVTPSTSLPLDVALHIVCAGAMVLLASRPALMGLLCFCVAADRTDAFWCLRPGAEPSALRVAPTGWLPRDERHLTVPAVEPNGPMMTGHLGVWGHNPVILLRGALMANAMSPGTFAFDDRGRLDTLFPRLRPEALVSPNGPSLLEALGVRFLRLPPRFRAAFEKQARLENAPWRRRHAWIELPRAHRARLFPRVSEARSLAAAENVLVDGRGICQPTSQPLIVPPHSEATVDAMQCRECPVLRATVLQEGTEPTLTLEARYSDGAMSRLLDVAGTHRAPGLTVQTQRKTIRTGWRNTSVFVHDVLVERPSNAATLQSLHLATAGSKGALLAVECSGRSPTSTIALPTVETGGSSVALSGESSPPMVVRQSAETPQHWRLSVAPGAGGWLLLSDSYAPGWRLTHGTQSIPVRPANLGLCAAKLPPGVDRLDLTYYPFSVRLGLFLSAVGLLGYTIAVMMRVSFDRLPGRGGTHAS